MADKDKKEPDATLKAAMETVSKEVAKSPDWLKSIYQRNDALIAAIAARATTTASREDARDD